MSVFPQAHFKQILVLGMADAWFFLFYRSAVRDTVYCCKFTGGKEKVSQKVKMTESSVRSNMSFFFVIIHSSSLCCGGSSCVNNI